MKTAHDGRGVRGGARLAKVARGEAAGKQGDAKGGDDVSTEAAMMRRVQPVASDWREMASRIERIGNESECPGDGRHLLEIARQMRGIALSVEAPATVAPSAMAWQDEPSGDGWYFVENWPGKIFRLVASGGGWIAHEAGAWNAFDLEFRRVCPIPAPPALPKRGDA